MIKWNLQLLAAVSLAAGLLIGSGAEAQQQLQSRLYEVTKNKKLRVCQYPLYYSISFRNPTTGKIRGDRPICPELARSWAELEIVDPASGPRRRPAGQQVREIGMFGVGATLKRAQAVEFLSPTSSPTFMPSRWGGKIKTWDDIDQKGIKAAVSLGSYIGLYEDLPQKCRGHLGGAAEHPRGGAGGATRRRHYDDFPTAIKVTDEFDWAATSCPRRSWR
jgi:hypothetical protein